MSEADDARRSRLANIAAQQEERRRNEADLEKREQPEAEARLELARVEDGVVRAPTRAEAVIIAWQTLLLAPFIAFAGIASAALMGGSGATVWAIGSFAGGAAVGLAIIRLALLTRERHVEHVRVRVFGPGASDAWVLLGATVVYALGAAVAAAVMSLR